MLADRGGFGQRSAGVDNYEADASDRLSIGIENRHVVGW